MLRDKENRLQRRLRQMNGGNNKPQWKKYDAQLVIFPTLSEQDERNICFGNYTCFSLTKYSLTMSIGNYQIQLAKAYIAEHLKPSILDEDELQFVVELCSKQNDLVRARFASRHSNRKTYITTV
jgi:hypothetical protein